MTTVGQNMTHTITSNSWCAFNITNIQYSNDGDSHRVSIYLDNDIVGDFNACGGDGNLWNVFKSSYSIGTTQIMSPGEHKLIVRLSSTDQYGVEIDKANTLFSLCDGECLVLLITCRPIDGEECDNIDRLEIENAFSTSLRSCDSLHGFPNSMQTVSK